MAFLIYDSAPSAYSGGALKLNANNQAAKHLKNYYALRKVFSTTSDSSVRRQAQSEMLVAERKITFWQRKQDFDQALYVADSRTIKFQNRRA